jgi:hypothetical protein
MAASRSAWDDEKPEAGYQQFGRIWQAHIHTTSFDRWAIDCQRRIFGDHNHQVQRRALQQGNVVDVDLELARQTAGMANVEGVLAGHEHDQGFEHASTCRPCLFREKLAAIGANGLDGNRTVFICDIGGAGTRAGQKEAALMDGFAVGHIRSAHSDWSHRVWG